MRATSPRSIPTERRTPKYSLLSPRSIPTERRTPKYSLLSPRSIPTERRTPKSKDQKATSLWAGAWPPHFAREPATDGTGRDGSIGLSLAITASRSTPRRKVCRADRRPVRHGAGVHFKFENHATAVGTPTRRGSKRRPRANTANHSLYRTSMPAARGQATRYPEGHFAREGTSYGRRGLTTLSTGNGNGNGNERGDVGTHGRQRQAGNSRRGNGNGNGNERGDVGTHGRQRQAGNSRRGNDPRTDGRRSIPSRPYTTLSQHPKQPLRRCCGDDTRSGS